MPIKEQRYPHLLKDHRLHLRLQMFTLHIMYLTINSKSYASRRRYTLPMCAPFQRSVSSSKAQSQTLALLAAPNGDVAVIKKDVALPYIGDSPEEPDNRMNYASDTKRLNTQAEILYGDMS